MNKRNEKLIGILVGILGIIINILGILVPKGALLALNGIIVAAVGIGTIAKAKGRSYRKWFLIGFLCPIVVFPIILCLENLSPAAISKEKLDNLD